jgi:hypothetical protein
MAIKISGTTVIPDTLGSANQVLKINAGGSAGEWADPSKGIAYVAKTANYTANINEGVVTDTSGGVFTVTLPASPSAGDLVVIADGAGTWDTNNLTVARNGETIDGDAENLVMDVEGAKVDFIYDGADWNVFSKAGFVTTASSFNETEFTATASQTTFVVSYTAGLVSVYLNGVRLAATDYTATNGTTVVLATGATAGDLVEVVAWSAFDVTNVATAGQGSLADSAVQPADSFDAANLTGTAAAINGSNITNLASANLTGALPAIDGSALTGVSSYPLAHGHFNGNGSISGEVHSGAAVTVTRVSTGYYRITFATDQGNYTVVGGGGFVGRAAVQTVRVSNTVFELYFNNHGNAYAADVSYASYICWAEE